MTINTEDNTSACKKFDLEAVFSISVSVCLSFSPSLSALPPIRISSVSSAETGMNL
jgi:hypothetical protein